MLFLPHTVIISAYAGYLMVSARPVQALLREELRMRQVTQAPVDGAVWSRPDLE